MGKAAWAATAWRALGEAAMTKLSQPNALDRLIAWVSPQAAMRRASARAVLAHY